MPVLFCKIDLVLYLSELYWGLDVLYQYLAQCLVHGIDLIDRSLYLFVVVF